MPTNDELIGLSTDQAGTTKHDGLRRSMLWAAVIVPALFLSVGCATATQSPAPTKTFTLRGQVVINNTTSGGITDLGSGCKASGGYSDLSPGTAVTVSDAHGSIVATGSLSSGMAQRTSMTLPGDTTATYFIASCALLFSVPNVPDGLPVYSVTVSHRGTQVIPATQAHDDVKLELGQGLLTNTRAAVPLRKRQESLSRERSAARSSSTSAVSSW